MSEPQKGPCPICDPDAVIGGPAGFLYVNCERHSPTPRGYQQWPPTGFYDYLPCRCYDSCPSTCRGGCGCEACRTAYSDQCGELGCE